MSEALSFYEKEARRWNTPKALGGTRPDTFQEFPLMVYRACKPAVCGEDCSKPVCVRYRGVNLHDMTVNGPDELARAREQFFVEGLDAAYETALAVEDSISRAAAERQTAERRMSPKAQAEAAEVDASTFEHVPEIPRKPAKKRGRSAAA